MKYFLRLNSQSRYPSAKPEALRLLAPERGPAEGVTKRTTPPIPALHRAVGATQVSPTFERGESSLSKPAESRRDGAKSPCNTRTLKYFRRWQTATPAPAKAAILPFESRWLWFAGALLLLSALAAGAQGRALVQLLEESKPLLLGSSQGYLGVELADVDAQKAQALKLKEVRGAVITLIDHDAPAGKLGLKVNDVVLQMNGQPVEGAEQLCRMLRETPPGRKVSLTISREGNLQTVAVDLADRKTVENDAWNKIDNGGDLFAPGPGMAILAGGKGSGGADAPTGSGFHLPFFGGSLNVGVMVEPLTTQMAEYLGVQNGLMVKQVAHKSAAAVAGLKAFDVILKVGSEPVRNLSGWDRALRANQGKTVQVTILRDRKQQSVTLDVDSKHHG